MITACANHPQDVAVWYCDRCERNFCEQCVQPKRYGTVDVVVCAQCQAACRSLVGRAASAAGGAGGGQTGVPKGLLIAGAVALVCFALAGITCLSGPDIDVNEVVEQMEVAGKPEPWNHPPRSRSHYDWDVVGRTTVYQTVYLEPAGFADTCFFVDVFLQVKAASYEGRGTQLLFFDDRAATPEDLSLSEDAKAHLRAKYVYNQSNGHEKLLFRPAGSEKLVRKHMPRKCPP